MPIISLDLGRDFAYPGKRRFPRRMNSKVRVLLLEDDPADAELIVRELRTARSHFDTQCVSLEADFRKALLDCKPHLILSDHKLPSFGATEALAIARAHDPNIPFILV